MPNILPSTGACSIGTSAQPFDAMYADEMNTSAMTLNGRPMVGVVRVNALPTTNLSEGMMAYVTTEQKTYQLKDVSTQTWEEAGSGGGGSAVTEASEADVVAAVNAAFSGWGA